MRIRFRLLVSVLPALWAGQAFGQVLDRSDYADRLRAMWLGECIANWTGLRTEGYRITPPFLTDADWDTTPPGRPPIEFVTWGDPWRADDDTDVEYVDLHLMTQHGHGLLTPAEIRDGWLLHMDPAWIWVSNHRAWDLMNRGVRPPATGMAVANEFFAFIDAQLTTEFYGALCPGAPQRTLELADLPIRTTASGFAIHASQFYALLYAYALQAPAGLSGRDRALWLVDRARQWIPSTSKAADIVDFVRADFLANPDVNNWELTRDRIASRYMLNAPANGFQYYAWTESSVNFACGVMCLLYGQCDFRRTVQIGTLSGWDSDNCTATMGGLLGFMLGYQQLTAQFPGVSFSDRYTIEPTRNNLPDYLPADPAAEDTFTLMAQRMLPLIDANITAAGGAVDAANNRWILPPAPPGNPLDLNPRRIDAQRSANNRVPAAGGAITCTSSAPSFPAGVPWVYGVSIPSFFANGYEADDSGRDLTEGRKYFFTTQGCAQTPGTVQTLTVEYDRPVPAVAIRFMEGDHFTPAGGYPFQGGWFQSLTVEIKVAGLWSAIAAAPSEPLDPAVPFQIIDFPLPAATSITGIRISGPCGGGPAEGFITCAELDAIAPAACYANCDGSTTPPLLNVLDFACFLNRFAAGDPAANCDNSATPPVLNVLDFSCFLNAFAVGCP